MAVVRAHRASSSACYDVFLSFRGEDTRKTFTDHLYTALVQHGFRTFRDGDEIEKGEYLKSELEKAILRSKVSIIVLSKDYASSMWCLDELVMILERRRTSGLVVLPVFYDVDPSQVRKQTGRTKDAFAKYEKQFEEEIDSEGKRKLMEKIKRWRSALTEVADLSGMDLRNQVDGHEAKFIQKIIEVIEDKLRHKTLDVAPYKVGINSRARDINMWLQDGSTDVSLRAICGMDGIGKTTIAKFVYDENFHNFDGSSFLANIREVSKQPNGLVRLQRRLLLDISRSKYGKIHIIDEGLSKIKSLIYSMRVLLVLDDVEQVDQIYAIVGMQDWLFSESKIIITTRHKGLLKPHQIFWVEKLGQDESIELFSFHAFGKKIPPESCREHTIRATQICDGLPLALKVVGSSLYHKKKDEWVSELAYLEAIPDFEILKILRISYDSLQDVNDKRVFLDIACFFVGIDKDDTIKILEKCDRFAKTRIQKLIDRCLLTTDDYNLLRMHQLIKDMGREIILQESAKAGKRSILWNHDDAFSVLRNETGTNKVEGLTLDMRMLKEVGNIADDIFLRSPKYIFLRTDAFKSMAKLRLLKLNYVQLAGSYDNFPESLVWLSWHGFSLKSIPVKFQLKKLVALDLRHSRLKQVWKETPFLESLKILDLSYSELLERTPNFKGLPNLERLILKGCMSLVEVCESIINLQMLDLLDLKNCKTLRKLPRNISNLGSLKTLVISGCNIEELPIEIMYMKSLEVLDANGYRPTSFHIHTPGLLSSHSRYITMGLSPITRKRASLKPALEFQESRIARDDIFEQVMGLERHGPVRALGLRPTPSSIFGPSYRQFETERRYIELRHQQELVRMRVQMEAENDRIKANMEAELQRVRDEMTLQMQQNERNQANIEAMKENGFITRIEIEAMHAQMRELLVHVRNATSSVQSPQDVSSATGQVPDGSNGDHLAPTHTEDRMQRQMESQPSIRQQVITQSVAQLSQGLFIIVVKGGY